MSVLFFKTLLLFFLCRYSDNCIKFNEPTEIVHEFVRVECEVNGKEIYRDFHGFFPLPKKETSMSENLSSVNILILGIDSLSRLNFIRKMPKTHEYITKVLEAIEMVGFNKVGENTFPNIVPLLSGFSVDELKFCWSNESAHFDLCPWIWKAFHDKGYATAFIEDTAWMGLFHYLKHGFVHQPTTYDGRPILYRAEKEIAHNRGGNSDYCVGPRTQIDMMTSYTYKLIRRMNHFKTRHFTYSWGTSLSHDYIEEPGVADKYYFNFLKKSNEEGLLDDTVLIFMSDHGLRWGSFVQTNQGRLEGLLPALYLVIPKWFQDKFPLAMKNLKANQHQLITKYDLHKTFYDLMNLKSLSDNYVSSREYELKSSANKRGISIFLPIPDRNCPAAGIPAEFCSCQHLEATDISLPIISEVAMFVVRAINAKLSNFPECVPLVFNKIYDAASGLPLDHPDVTVLSTEYKVSFYTEPGNGLFSASVYHFPRDGSMELVGDISRLNAYGKQSHCISDYKLRPFCYCVNQI